MTPSNISCPYRQLHQKKVPAAGFPGRRPAYFGIRFTRFVAPRGATPTAPQAGPTGRRPAHSVIRSHASWPHWGAPPMAQATGSTCRRPAHVVHEWRPARLQERPKRRRVSCTLMQIVFVTCGGPLGALLEHSWGPLGAFLGPSRGPSGPPEGPKNVPRGPQEGPPKVVQRIRANVQSVVGLSGPSGSSLGAPIGGALGPWDGSKRLRDCPRPPQDSSETAVEHHG